MNEKHCGFCISQPCRSRVAAGILMKSCRETAFQARRQPASSPKIKNKWKTLWVFTFYPPVLGPRCAESWKTLGITALQTTHQVAICARKKTERRTLGCGWGTLYLPEWIAKHWKSVSIKALLAKRAHMDASRNYKMN